MSQLSAEKFEMTKQGREVYFVHKSFLDELPLPKFEKYIYLSYARDAELSIMGRGTVRYIMLASGRKVVVRKGLRGGFISRFNAETYFQSPSTDISDARQVRELEILDFLLEKQVAVPQPVAAFIQYLPFHIGYQGFLATQDIGGHNLLHLGSSVVISEMGEDAFKQYCHSAGVEARKMLNAGVYHPDLHPGNVLYSNSGKIYLIDFDNAQYLGGLLSRAEAQRKISQRWARACSKHFLEDFGIAPFEEGLRGTS